VPRGPTPRGAAAPAATRGPVVVATVLAVALVALGVRCGIITWPAAASAAAVALGAFALCYRCFRARAGGITGDFLGACQQLTEIGVLCACVFLCPASPAT
jgi:adenosylcobinamide-GDP ribazoletransferase